MVVVKRDNAPFELFIEAKICSLVIGICTKSNLNFHKNALNNIKELKKNRRS